MSYPTPATGAPQPGAPKYPFYHHDTMQQSNPQGYPLPTPAEPSVPPYSGVPPGPYPPPEHQYGQPTHFQYPQRQPMQQHNLNPQSYPTMPSAQGLPQYHHHSSQPVGVFPGNAAPSPSNLPPVAPPEYSFPPGPTTPYAQVGQFGPGQQQQYNTAHPQTYQNQHEHFGQHGHPHGGSESSARGLPGQIMNVLPAVVSKFAGDGGAPARYPGPAQGSSGSGQPFASNHSGNGIQGQIMQAIPALIGKATGSGATHGSHGAAPGYSHGSKPGASAPEKLAKAALKKYMR